MPQDNNYPLVSIIIPVYNGERTLQNCLDSLAAQDYPDDNLEIIVVDNNSTDNTASIIQKYPVKYFKETKQGPSAARNCGIKHSRGEVIAFTDADCVAHPNWIAEGISSLREEKVGAVVGKILGYEPSNWVEEYLVTSGCLSEESSLNHQFLPYGHTANAFFRKSALKAVGGFDETLHAGEDADIFWRVLINTPYTLSHGKDAIVYHHHRATLKALFKQHFGWGCGAVRLYKKYYSKMERPLLKQYYWTYRGLLGRLIKVPVLWYRTKRGKHDDKEFTFYLCKIITQTGTRLGYIYGSLKEKTLYL